jgi:DNA replication licensing factor MCM2
LLPCRPQTRVYALLLDHSDYIENRKLDVYDAGDLNDDEDFSDDPETRRAAEDRMERRDRRAARAAGGAGERRKARMPGFLASEEEDSEDEGQLLGRRRVRRMYDEPFGDDDAGFDEVRLLFIFLFGQLSFSLDSRSGVDASLDFRRKCPSSNSPTFAPTRSHSGLRIRGRGRRSCASSSSSFLPTPTSTMSRFTDLASTSWVNVCFFFSLFSPPCRLAHVALFTVNSESLEISFLHLTDSKAILAYFLANCPAAMLPIFDDVALDVILLAFPHYTRIHAEVHVRITELPTSYTLRDLRQSHLDALVRVSGVVTRRSGVFPQLKYVKFDCQKCGEVLGPFYQDATSEIRIQHCAACASKGPFIVNSEQVRLFNPP